MSLRVGIVGTGISQSGPAISLEGLAVRVATQTPHEPGEGDAGELVSQGPGGAFDEAAASRAR